MSWLRFTMMVSLLVSTTSCRAALDAVEPEIAPVLYYEAPTVVVARASGRTRSFGSRAGRARRGLAYSAASAITERAHASVTCSSGTVGTMASTGHTGTQALQSRQTRSSIR